MFKKNNDFRNTDLFILLLISCLAISCTTNSEGDNQLNLEGQWKLQALENLEINSINASADPMLISTSEGIHSKEGTDFIEFGLKEKPIVNVIQIAEEEYIAAIETLQLEGGDTTLYKTNNNGEQWTPHMGSFGGEENKYTRISDLQIKESGSSTFYACGGGNVARTTDGGSSWSSVHLTWEHLGFALFVKPDPNDSDIIWAGGANAIFEPKLVKSDDGGNSWVNLSKNLQTTENETFETNAYDILIDTDQSSNLLLGLGSGILKSTSDGETWSNSFSGASITTFARSVLNSGIVYASGRNSTGTLFFFASEDFGDTWQIIEFEDGPGGIQVNDMVSVQENGKEVLYLGTNKGLYSFTLE
jgi:photosystem II stability/assembly factor-like uncharacterized protein